MPYKRTPIVSVLDNTTMLPQRTPADKTKLFFMVQVAAAPRLPKASGQANKKAPRFRDAFLYQNKNCL